MTNWKNMLRLMSLAILATAALTLNSCKEDEDPCDDIIDNLTAEEESTNTDLASYFSTAGNRVEDPGFGATDITPNISNVTLTNEPTDLTDVNYYGAIDPAGTPWYQGWSFYDQLVQGNTTDIDRSASVPSASVTVTDNGNGIPRDTLYSDTVYVLDGFCFVNSGNSLYIEAGTIIKGKPGQAADASALIVARGAQIYAMGTATNPIIMTAEADALDGTSTATTRGLWGGLIVLGNATLNSTPGETSVEGIPTTETRALYGGSNDADDSGVIRYVSIRHGGTDIGAGNEINGLTLGGVGSATTISHVEIVANKDDGIEFFGGLPNVTNLIAAFCGDDAIDYDEGFRGKVQFAIVHQAPGAGAGDRGGEHDGGTDPESGTPFATPQFFNVTSVGNGENRALTFRDNAGGEYHNSIFYNWSKGVDIELKDATQHSVKQYNDGNLKLENNIWFDIDAGTTGADLFVVSIDNACFE